jgi:DNA-binding transcriptional MocR family regulator
VALASLIAESGLERHLRRMHERYAAKRHALVGSLVDRVPGVRVGGASAGLHLIAWLPADVDEHESAVRARASGVGTHELHYHRTTVAPHPPAFVLGCAVPAESELRTAATLLGQAIAHRPQSQDRHGAWRTLAAAKARAR